MKSDATTSQLDGQRNLDFALRYVDLGWSIIPLCPFDHLGIRTVSKDHHKTCKSPGKCPWIPWAPYQERLATHDEVRHWWRQLVNSNVGCALGPVDRLLRVDIEGPASLERLKKIARGALPPTVEFKSGRADGTGSGMLFEIPAGVDVRTSIEHCEGGELRFQWRGAQTVLPPSRHKDGNLYEWLMGASPFERRVAQAPDWLIDHLRAGKTREREPGEDDEDDDQAFDVFARNENFAGKAQGARNSAMASLLGGLLYSVAELDNKRALNGVWSAACAVNDQNTPPMTEAELKKIFNSILKTERKRREQNDVDALQRFIEQGIEESCRKDGAAQIGEEKPKAAPTTFTPSWHLIVKKTEPKTNYLRSPLWSHKPEVADSDGYIKISTGDLCHWSKIIKVAAEEASVRIPDKVKNLNWPKLLNQLYDSADVLEAVDETKRTRSVLHFLYELLLKAREINKNDDGTPVFSPNGSPQVFDDAIIVKLEWLLSQTSFCAEPYKSTELVDGMQRIGMQPRQLGPENKRRRWWSLSKAQFTDLTLTLFPQEAGSGLPKTDLPTERGSNL